MSDADSPEAWAEIEAKEIRLFTGTPIVGLWCPTCLLPSGYEVRFYRDPAMPRSFATIRRCFTDADHRIPKEEGAP